MKPLEEFFFVANSTPVLGSSAAVLRRSTFIDDLMEARLGKIVNQTTPKGFVILCYSMWFAKIISDELYQGKLQFLSQFPYVIIVFFFIGPGPVVLFYKPEA